MQIPLARWVSPFGHHRIKACCQLPDAFRRLPRPSSPPTAKASTVCAYSLDHITPNRLPTTCSYGPPTLPQRHVRVPIHVPHQAFAQHSSRSDPKRFLFPSCKRTVPGLNTRYSQNLLSSSHPERRAPGGGSGRTRTSDLTLIRGAL